MPWRVEISRRGQRDLDRLTVDDYRAIAVALRRLEDDPSAVDMRKLAGRSNDWRLRVGRWRVLLRAENRTGTLFVERVLDRRDAYRD